MKRFIAVLFAAVLAFGVAKAGNDKGQGQGKGQQQSQAQGYHYEDLDDDGKGKPRNVDDGPDNKGQVTSECNHRANERT